MSVQVARAPIRQVIVRLRDAAQRGETVDVEDVVAEGFGALRRIEIRAAGENAPAILAKQGERLIDRGGFRVTDHALPSRTFPETDHSHLALPKHPGFGFCRFLTGQIHSYANDIRRAGIVKARVRAAMATCRPGRICYGLGG